MSCGLHKKIKICVGSCICKFLRSALHYGEFKLIRITCQAACHGKTEHGIFVKFKKPSKTAVVLIAGVTILGTPCPRHIIVPLGAEAMWPRPEQSHLLPEACSPNGTDNRQQRQRWTKRPLPKPSDILKRFYALYKLRYYMKKVSILYFLFNPLTHSVFFKGC